MKKVALIFVALCALVTFRVSGQQNCSGFFFVTQFDTTENGYVGFPDQLFLYLATTTDRTVTPLSSPPGFTFHDSGFFASFIGQVDTPGTYEFSLEAYNSELGCYNKIIFHRTYVNHVCEEIDVASSHNPGSEYFPGDSIKVQYYVYGGDPPYTFEGIGMPAGATLDPETGLHKYRPTTPNYYEFDVQVTDYYGCTGTYHEVITVMCNPIPNYFAALSARKGMPYSASTPNSPRNPPPYSGFNASGLPPGLTISSTTGVISGTPTQYGIFDSSVGYTSLGGCRAVTEIQFTIHNDALPTQSLWITPQCAPSISQRRWVVHNPNPMDVLVEWENVYDTYAGHRSGSFVATNGNNILTMYDAGWPNTIRIKWYDHTNTLKQIIQGANDDLCTPPSCVQATGVTFFHQGLRRDLTPVEPWMGYPVKALGAPDASDSNTGGYTSSVALGYYGFITLKLSANLYDGPGTDLKVWEWSANNPDYGANPERAEVYVSTDNSNWISLGLTNPTGDCHSKLDWEFDLAGKAAWCRYVKVVDRTYEWARVLDPTTCALTPALAFNDQSNGFDLDAITCGSSIPPNNPPARIAADDDVALMENKEGAASVLSPNPASSLVTFDFSGEKQFDGGSIKEVDCGYVRQKNVGTNACAGRKLTCRSECRTPKLRFVPGASQGERVYEVL